MPKLSSLQFSRLQIGDFFFQLSAWSIRFFLACFPFQIRTLIYNESFYLTGNFNVFRSVFLYLSDILLIVSLLSFGIHSILNKKSIQNGHTGISKFWALWILSFGLSIFFAEDKTLSFFLWLRLFEGLGLYLLIINQILSFKNIINWFCAGIFFQAVIALGQFIHQASLGLHFLGEPLIGKNIEGVAKLEFHQFKVVRPYGTFSHPNILAGSFFMAFTLVCFKNFSLKKRKILYFSLLGIFIVAFLITFSRSAFVAAFVAAFVYLFLMKRKTFVKIAISATSLITAAALSMIFWKGNPLSTLLFASHGEAIQERLTYFIISLKMFLAHPLGVGLGHFTFAMQDFTTQKLSPWLFQPVHNVFLLILNEGGMITAAFFIALVIIHVRALIKILKYFKHFSGKESNDIKKQATVLLALISGVMVIGLFDHYFISLPEGQTLLFLFAGLLGVFLNNVSKKMKITF